MKERERLIELLNVNMSEDCGVWDMADYLLENGVVVLPCRVGDNIWRHTAYSTKVQKGEIYSITITYSNNCVLDGLVEIAARFDGTTELEKFYLNRLGVNWWLDEQEAEKALERSDL